MTSRERLYLFDTTLRDGAQTTGVDFSALDKRRIAAVLDDLGIDYMDRRNGLIEDVTVEDIRRVAERLFAGREPIVVRVGQPDV